MTTHERVAEIVTEAKKAQKTFSYCYIGTDERTALVTVANPERITGMQVPQFYVAKIHNGHMVGEQFV